MSDQDADHADHAEREQAAATVGRVLEATPKQYHEAVEPWVQNIIGGAQTIGGAVANEDKHVRERIAEKLNDQVRRAIVTPGPRPESTL